MRKLSLQELNRVSVETFKQQTKTPLIVVLDNVRSALNVGSVFRTADAFALTKVVLCGITATPPHREILKTALGANEAVEWEYVADSVLAVKALQGAGWVVLAVEQAEGSVLLDAFEVKNKTPYAVVLGNEVKGVRDEVMAIVDGCLEIPQLGTKHSLNISVCAGIVVWDLFVKLQQR